MRRCLIGIVLALSAAPALAAPSDVLLTVDGRPISRKDVDDRLWGLYANSTVQQMIDDSLMREASENWQKRISRGKKQAVDAEADARLADVRSQFGDEAAFRDNLRKNGMTEAALRSQIRTQVVRENMVADEEKITVTPSEVRTFFQTNKEKLGTPEAVHLLSLRLSSDLQARDLFDALRAGADFRRLSAKLAQDATSKAVAGDLGFVPRGVLAPNIEKAVFSLKPGEVTDLIPTGQGIYIFNVLERRRAKPAAFDEAKKGLAQALLLQKINQVLPAYLQSLRARAKITPAASGGEASPAGFSRTK